MRSVQNPVNLHMTHPQNPVFFLGNLGDSVMESFKTVGKRFTFGGDTAKDQRVYYFNTKELIDNKFGTPNPIPFRVVDSKIGLDADDTSAITPIAEAFLNNIEVTSNND